MIGFENLKTPVAVNGLNMFAIYVLSARVSFRPFFAAIGTFGYLL